MFKKYAILTVMKVCIKCQQEKEPSEFYRNQTAKDGLMVYCKKCTNTNLKKWQGKRRERTETVGRKADKTKSKLFAFWQSIPGILKQKEYFKLKDIKLTDEQESILPELLRAKNLKEVSKVLGVSYNTVLSYQKSSYVQKMTEYFDRWNNAMKFKRDVDYAFTNATIKNADAPRVKLWKQIYEGWVEETKSVQKFDEKNILEIQSKLREIATKKHELPKPIRAPDNIISVNDPAESNADGLGGSKEYCQDALQKR